MVAAPEVNNTEQSSCTDAETVVIEPASGSMAESSLQQAEDLMKSGKRDLLCDNVPSAVEAFSKACELLVEHHKDEMHIDLAPAYMLYGDALLQLSRMETSVLGNAIQGIPTTADDDKKTEEEDAFIEDDGMDEKEREEVAEQVSEALDSLAPPECVKEQEQEPEEMQSEDAAGETEDNETSEKESVVDENQDAEMKDASTEKEVDGESDEKEVDDELEEKEVDESDKKEVEGASTEKEVDGESDEKPAPGEKEASGELVEECDDEKEEDEDDSLKLAWEMLDLTRKVYEGNNTDGSHDKMLIECYMKLGEVLMESSHHDDADKEYLKAVDLQMKTRNDDNEREIAQSYFIAGLNKIYANAMTEAAGYLQKAIEIMDSRQVKFTDKLSTVEGDEKVKLEKELAEIADILPLMNEKLLETKTATQDEKSSESKFSEESKVLDAETKDITHLVKRKPATEPKEEVNEKDVLSENGLENKVESPVNENVTMKRKAEEEEKEDTLETKKAKVDDSTTAPPTEA